MMPARALLLVVLALPLLGLSSCCTMARFFCGPDDSRWVSVAYDSPTATTATLLEAVRRDAPDVVYTCMTEGWKQRNKVGSLEAQVAWEKIKEQVPGIHLLGYAEIPRPTRTGPDAAHVIVETAGQKVRFDLLRLSFEELVYERDEDHGPGECRRELASWHQRAELELVEDAETDRSRLTLVPFEFNHRGSDKIPLSSVERFALVRQWHVDNLRLIEE